MKGALGGRNETQSDYKNVGCPFEGMSSFLLCFTWLNADPCSTLYILSSLAESSLSQCDTTFFSSFVLSESRRSSTLSTSSA